MMLLDLEEDKGTSHISYFCHYLSEYMLMNKCVLFLCQYLCEEIDGTSPAGQHRLSKSGTMFSLGNVMPGRCLEERKLLASETENA